MKVTDKAKEQFEKWYNKSNNILQYETEDFSGDGLGFTDLPDSMKFGVYVDFFDSVGINIEIQIYSFDDGSVCYESRTSNIDLEQHKTRTEARTSAIEKANEILNKAT